MPGSSIAPQNQTSKCSLWAASLWGERLCLWLRWGGPAASSDRRLLPRRTPGVNPGVRQKSQVPDRCERGLQNLIISQGGLAAGRSGRDAAVTEMHRDSQVLWGLDRLQQQTESCARSPNI